ncbi:MAG: hypothetical protein JWP11_3801 [Frankiales bacterium]|nr:hypothetical protein [Frankiales bacterium]
MILTRLGRLLAVTALGVGLVLVPGVANAATGTITTACVGDASAGDGGWGYYDTGRTVTVTQAALDPFAPYHPTGTTLADSSVVTVAGGSVQWVVLSSPTLDCEASNRISAPGTYHLGVYIDGGNCYPCAYDAASVFAAAPEPTPFADGVTLAVPAVDPLHAADDGIFGQLGAGLHHPIMALGLPLAAVSICIGLVIRWARRAVTA